jgi:hypothetical protein
LIQIKIPGKITTKAPTNGVFGGRFTDGSGFRGKILCRIDKTQAGQAPKSTALFAPTDSNTRSGNFTMLIGDGFRKNLPIVEYSIS